MRAILIVLGLLGFCACAENPQKQDTHSKSQYIILKGSITMKGSSRINFLAITDSHSGREYKILNPQTFNLLNKQNHILILKAKVFKKAIGPGFPTEIEVLEIY